MPETVSIDEFLSQRKGFVKAGDVLMKAAKAPPTWDAERRSARFVMSAEVEDRDRDIVVQDGLDITEFMKNPIAPFQHASYTFPVGTWSDVAKNLAGRPKRTEGTLNLVKEGVDGVADRLAFHIGEGTIKACSIGFIPKAVERREVPEDKKDTYFWPGYRILEAELVECSPVTIPSNPAALAKSAHQGDKLARETIEEILDTWVKHPETGLLIPREEFEAAHKEASGDRTSVTVNITGASVPDDVRHKVEAGISAAIAGKGGHVRAPADEPGLFTRFLARLGFSGEEAEARAKNAMQASLAEAERKAAEQAAAKQAALSRFSALNERLAAKGLTT